MHIDWKSGVYKLAGVNGPNETALDVRWPGFEILLVDVKMYAV